MVILARMQNDLWHRLLRRYFIPSAPLWVKFKAFSTRDRNFKTWYVRNKERKSYPFIDAIINSSVGEFPATLLLTRMSHCGFKKFWGY